MSRLVKLLKDLFSCFSGLDLLHCRILEVNNVSRDVEWPFINVKCLGLYHYITFLCFCFGLVWLVMVCIVFFSQAKNDPFKKEPSKKEAEDKAGSSKSSDKRSSTGMKLTNKWVRKKLESESFADCESTFNLMFSSCRTQPSYKKEDKKMDKQPEKDRDLSKKQEAKSGKSDSVSPNSGQGSSKKDDRKHGSRFCSSSRSTHLMHSVKLINDHMLAFLIFLYFLFL